MQRGGAFWRLLRFRMLPGGVRVPLLNKMRSAAFGRVRPVVDYLWMRDGSTGIRQREYQGDTDSEQSLSHKLSSAENQRPFSSSRNLQRGPLPADRVCR